jgi:hypothetical protein
MGGDPEIRPGMTFALEPNACLDTRGVNIGGALIVAETGCEELNAIPTSTPCMTHAGLRQSPANASARRSETSRGSTLQSSTSGPSRRASHS